MPTDECRVINATFYYFSEKDSGNFGRFNVVNMAHKMKLLFYFLTLTTLNIILLKKINTAL